MRKLVVLALAVVCFFLSLYGGFHWWFTHYVPNTFSYCVERAFDKLPADDQRLIEWLQTQPGISPNSVMVRRFGVKGNLLEVGFMQVATLAGEPPFPDLNTRCAELGYEGPAAPFRDCENRNR